MKEEKSCGAVVYKIENGMLFFLVEHMVKGHISIPKGHMEGSETEEETAIREIREETNLKVKLDTVFRHVERYSPAEGISKTVVFFAAEPVTKDLKKQDSEIARLMWLPCDEAIEIMTYDSSREVLIHAAVYLEIKYGQRWLPSAVKRFGWKWYCEHAVDIHSHVMPGVDDGARSMNEAMEMLRMVRDQGIRVVFATPHYGEENGYAPDSNDVWFGFNRLTEAAREAVPGIHMAFGNEWYCAEDIVDRIKRHEAWSLMPSDYYMVEFLEYGSKNEPAEDMLRRLKKMKDNGIKTILSHPERYHAIQQDWDLARRICDLNVKLQVNAYDLALNKNDQTRNLAQWMAEEHLISFIGSDMHGTRDGARPPKMREGIRWLYDHVNDEYADEIIRVNAERYLNVPNLLQDC